MIALALSILSMLVAVACMLVARNAYHRTRRVAARVLGYVDAPRCRSYVFTGFRTGADARGPIQCALHHNHFGNHLIEPAELGDALGKAAELAGYVRPPF